MKKIIPILFLFIMAYLCYLIYNNTVTKRENILYIGDTIIDNKDLKKELKYNNIFMNKEYRLIDLLNIIKYNQEIIENNKTISIHQLLKKANIVIISIGMNDLYYKLDDNTKEIYTYINNLVDEYDDMLAYISKYDYDKVILIGYYNISNQNNDIFTYTNYKIKKLATKYNYDYLNLNDTLYNNKIYIKDKFYLNREGFIQINKLIVEKIKKS